MRHTTLLLLLSLGIAATAAAEPTSIAVHVISHDAKFIGTSMGGARISIVDARTGELLAQGVTEGSTGDTDRIMRQPRQRGVPVVTPDAAAFTATLEIAVPMQVQVIAHGPLDYPDSANTVSATQWILPGGHVKPWILEMPGLVVDLHDTAALVRRENGAAEVSLAAHVSMMCGCPLTPDGLWDSNEFAIEAQILKDGLPVTAVTLDYAGEASEFAGSARVTEPGRYEVLVTAYQARTGNTGVDRASFVVD